MALFMRMTVWFCEEICGAGENAVSWVIKIDVGSSFDVGMLEEEREKRRRRRGRRKSEQ